MKRKKRELEGLISKNINQFCKETGVIIDNSFIDKINITTAGDEEETYQYTIQLNIKL